MLSALILTLRTLYFELSELHVLEHFQVFTGLVTAQTECSAFPIRESKGPAHSDAVGEIPNYFSARRPRAALLKRDVGGWRTFYSDISKIHPLKIKFPVLKCSCHKPKAPFAPCVLAQPWWKPWHLQAPFSLICTFVPASNAFCWQEYLKVWVLP